jgi:hypothetical protein
MDRMGAGAVRATGRGLGAGGTSQDGLLDGAVCGAGWGAVLACSSRVGVGGTSHDGLLDGVCMILWECEGSGTAITWKRNTFFRF